MKYQPAVHTFINLMRNSDALVNCNGIVYLLEDFKPEFEARCREFIKQRQEEGTRRGGQASGRLHYALRLLLKGEQYYISSKAGNHVGIQIWECAESVANQVRKIEAKTWSCYRKLIGWDPAFEGGAIKPFPEELENSVAQFGVAHQKVYVTHYAFGRFCNIGPVAPDLGMIGYAETRAQKLKRLCNLVKKSTLMRRKNSVNQLLRYNGEYAMYRVRNSLVMIFTWDIQLEAWVMETCYEKPNPGRREIYKDVSTEDKVVSWKSPSVFA